MKFKKINRLAIKKTVKLLKEIYNKKFKKINLLAIKKTVGGMFMKTHCRFKSHAGTSYFEGKSY
jgi:hypothetical protein